MYTAYFFEVALPGPAGGLWGGAWPAAYQIYPVGTVAENQAWHDELARHQAIYEELLASPEWAGARERPTPKQRPLSVRELTRDLAGWAPPQPGALRVGNSSFAWQR